MMQTETTPVNSRTYPVRKHIAWWQDWEFTNDLLLHPQRPMLTDVAITGAAHPVTFETVVEIHCQVRNLLDADLRGIQVHAVIIDEFGMIMTRPNTRVWTRLQNLAAQGTKEAQLNWQRECPAQSYRLVLRLEDYHGKLLDVVAGDFVIG